MESSGSGHSWHGAFGAAEDEQSALASEEKTGYANPLAALCMVSSCSHVCCSVVCCFV